MGFPFFIPPAIVEILGTVGLIMIVLEAGLDLEVTRSKVPLIRSSFRSASIVFLLSTFAVTGILKWWLPETDLVGCIVYAIVLSIVSSAIVLPSVHHLSHEKKEFLIYEASFSDVLGIMAFNFFTVGPAITLQSAGWFAGSIPLALLLSVGLCFALMWLLVKSQAHVKFFLIFAVLIVIYVGGKVLNLPSLITILMFGLVVNNWELIRWRNGSASNPSKKAYCSLWCWPPPSS